MKNKKEFFFASAQVKGAICQRSKFAQNNEKRQNTTTTLNMHRIFHQWTTTKYTPRGVLNFELGSAHGGY